MITDDLKRLQRRLQRCGTGFSLFFVRCNLPEYCLRLTEKLQQGLARPIIAIDLHAVSPLEISLDSYIAQHMENAPADSMIFLHGLEDWLPASQRETQHQILQQINWRRSSFAALRKPLLVWLPDYALKILAHLAPDFYDWYSGVYELECPEDDKILLQANAAKTLSEGVSDEELPGITNMSLAEKQRWLRTLLALLDEFSEQNNHRARLLRDAAWLYQATGERESAITVFQEFLALQQALGKPDELAKTYGQFGRLYRLQRQFKEAEQWLKKALACFDELADESGMAVSYHRLGINAEGQRDFQAAEQWYKKSLAIKEKQGNEHGAAITYHQLGSIAEEQRDFQAAEQWYKKSLAIWEKQENEYRAAGTYHQLGVNAQDQRDFEAAEQWYKKSLTIEKKQGNEHGAAQTYHQLGNNAQDQRDFQAAEQWYKKSLVIKEKQGNEDSAASTYHQLGMNAQKQQDFQTAEQWYKKSLAIKEKQGSEHGAANTYYQLGNNAFEQQDFLAAEQWYKKSLAIWEKQGNEHGAALTYVGLGVNAGDQGEAEAAATWFLKAAPVFVRCQDPYSGGIVADNYAYLLQQADAATRTELLRRWRAAGLDKSLPLKTQKE
ncbi:MAG: tetratricopeptide repeat protein [Gammaproteobacteria bacterium]|nr:tetratricopeptide repeat protein [Gammaproteobacteria bacterium]